MDHSAERAAYAAGEQKKPEETEKRKEATETTGPENTEWMKETEGMKETEETKEMEENGAVAWLMPAAGAFNGRRIPAGLSYEEVRNQLCVCLINYEHNRRALEVIPHIRREDLAAVMMYFPGGPAFVPGEEQEMLVCGGDLSRWGKDVYQVYRDALVSGSRLRPAFFAPMRRILGMPEETQEGEIPMYVLSCRDLRYGASVMLYPGVLAQIARGIGDDLYIIPSSVHELILLRESDVQEPGELVQIIREVNRCEVLPGERLSDSLYHYTLSEDALTRADLYFSPRKRYDDSTETDLPATR